MSPYADTLTVIDTDGARRTIRRTTHQPVRSWKAQHPRRTDGGQ